MRASAGFGGEDGVAGDEDEAEEVVADGVVDGWRESGTVCSISASSRASSWCLRRGEVLRRKRSMARCLAVAMSHAPGLSGMPDCGHCSSAATRASWARSSAQADVAGEAGEAGDDAGGLDAPDGFDGAV